MRILLVEDDDSVVEQLKPVLKKAGYAVEIARDGIDGEFLGNEENFDAVILDIGLPGRTGLEVLQHWRANKNLTPVVILTARDAWRERVDGLKAGADDYLGKPFHPEELIARLDSVLRRTHGRAANMIEMHGLKLDCDTQSITLASGDTETLTNIEFRLLRYLMSHPDQLISKRELSEHVYEEEQLRDSNVIEVYINRLRQRLGHDAIETRRGQGYRLRGTP